MSGNFWDKQLSGDDSKDMSDKSTRRSFDSNEREVRIDVHLDDFPVNDWDSDNDARFIVEWYNMNRVVEDEKTLEFFKSGSGVTSIYSRSQAQKLLDFTIQTLEQEGCTVWDMPQNTIEIHPGATIVGLVGGWTFAGLWCTVSFVALFFLVGPVLADLGTSEWNATNGVIIDSGVDSSTDGEGGTTYCLLVDYQYTYDN